MVEKFLIILDEMASNLGGNCSGEQKETKRGKNKKIS